MRVLFISDGLSLNTGQGIGARRNLSIIRNISKEIKIFSLEDGTKLDNLESDITIINYNESKIKKIFDLLSFRFYYTKKSEKMLINYTHEYKPDIIFIDSSNLGNLSRKLSKINPNIITYFIDFNMIKLPEMLIKSKFRNIFHIYSLFFNELFSIKYSKAAFILTRRELKSFHFFNKKIQTFILPITIEDKFQNFSKPQNISNTILFVGANYYPNILGLNIFLKECFSNLPEYKLIIAGKNLSKNLFKFNEIDFDRIEILTNISDEKLIDLYQKANLVICPILHGGGMKIKVAEAMMHGKIIVATKFSFDGYENIVSQDIYLSNNIYNFIENINIASKSESYRNHFSEINRNLFLKNYTYENSRNIFISAFNYLKNI